MNKILLHNICQHIFTRLGIISGSFINKDKLISLNNNKFLLPKTIKFEEQDTSENNFWGAELSINEINNGLKLLLIDASTDSSEYCLLVSPFNGIKYAIYFINDDIKQYSLICMLLHDKWFVCNTKQQAELLSTMESLMDFPLQWSKIDKFEDELQLLIKFVDYYDEIMNDEF